MTATCIGPVPGVRILGTGTAFPDRVLDNAAVLRHLGALRGRPPSEEQLAFAARSLTAEHGFDRRAWAHLPGTPLDHEAEPTVVDLGAAAADAALADAGVAAAEIGALFCATSTPHRMTSTVSAALGAQLGVEAMCLDTRAGCAAALFSLATAALYVAAGVSPVLLVGVDTFSKVIPAHHKGAALSLADGAGALVLGAGGGALLGASMETDGRLGGLVMTPGALPPTQAEIEADGYVLAGDPEGLAGAIPDRYVAALTGALGRAGLPAAELDAYVPHQVGRPVVEAVCARLGIALSRTWLTPGRHGNLGSAGWLVALAEARAEGFVGPGQTLALASVGGGMSWAAVVLRA